MGCHVRFHQGVSMRTVARWAASTIVAALVVAVTSTAASAGPSAAGPDPAALQAAITPHAGEPAAGVVARVTVSGQTWRGSWGDRLTGVPVPPGAFVRIGSITKTFEATVVLQLAAEHVVDLDQTVRHYLPGLLPAAFRRVTVRELLNHTSGLPQIDQGAPEPGTDQVIDDRFGYQSFVQIIERTLRPAGRPWPGPAFTPGTAQQYDSLNYRVAGALVERVTGRPYAEEVYRRVIAPLGLHRTFLPGRDPLMPSPHLHGYLTRASGAVVDVSAQGNDPSSTISTVDDLDRFLTALFQGELLPPAALAEMFTLPRDASGALLPYRGDDNCTTGPQPGRACFSSGLMAVPLPGGVVLWGKTGHDLGYASGMFATRDLSRRGVYSVGTVTEDDPTPTAVANRLVAAVFAS